MRKPKTYRLISTPMLALLALLFCVAATIAAAPGDLDPTFGVGGTVIDGSGGRLYDVAIQPDGKIVVAGEPNFSVARYKTDGSPDISFGDNGRVTTTFGSEYAAAIAIAAQRDGKLVVAGYVCPCDDYGAAFFALTRYNTDGSLDLSFDGDGKVTTAIGLRATGYAVAVQPDNKIIVAGWSWDSAPPYVKDHFAVARYNPDGSLDTTFGSGGTVSTSICGNCNDEAFSVAVQPDGKIVAVGGGFDGTPNTQFTVVRYNANGSLDNTFDSDGRLTTSFGIGQYAQAVAIQGDGKIIAGGVSWNSTSDFVLARYNSNGSLDTTFDLDGKVTTPIGLSWDRASSIAIQPDGKIVASGSSYNGANADFAIARYNPNGSLDSTYGGGDGIVTVDFGNSDDNSYGMKLDNLGRAVVVGQSGQNNVIARFLGDATACPNPIDCNEFFVRQHYQDFLNREPDASGLAYWTGQLEQCGANAACIHQRRIGVSAAFFVEMEFQETGYYIYRFYKASFGRQPTFNEFTADRAKVVGGSNLEASKQAFADEWVQRPAFVAAYPITMSNTEVVNKLFDTAGLTASIYDALRQQEIQALNAGGSRARVLRDVIEIPDFKNVPDPNDPRYSELKQVSQYNPAFVLMQYFGYLRRDPEQGGYEFWLDILNNREPNNFRGMVCSFITSTEYQLRFGSIVTRSNVDCGQ